MNSGEPASSSGKKRSLEGDEDVDIDLVEVVNLIREWVIEIKSVMKKDEGEQEAWDDVKGGELLIKEVKAARKEEVTYMEKREIWGLSPIQECWDKTGKAPVSVRWVDTDNGGDTAEEWEIRAG